MGPETPQVDGEPAARVHVRELVPQAQVAVWYVRDAAPASYDAIIVDSTDPIGVGEVLFTDAFYADCARILTPRGVIVNQCGVPFGTMRTSPFFS